MIHVCVDRTATTIHTYNFPTVFQCVMLMDLCDVVDKFFFWKKTILMVANII